MAELTRVFTDRRRAESFGSVADDYDRYRPQYPRALIAQLVTRPGLTALDVGAGTGIASEQLVRAGADVLAVEPDAKMTAIAESKGITVERSSFEEWRSEGRTFDLVVFGQSFHWVDPDVALPRLASLLNPDARLALLWNRITPTEPKRAGLERISKDFGVATPSANSAGNAETALRTLLGRADFDVERIEVSEAMHYSTSAWLGLVFTHSNHVVLEPDAREELRTRLRDWIGDDGVGASNDALALICSLKPVSRG